MNAASLRSPFVRRVIETINQGRLDDFMALFAHDATLVDGPTYKGYEAIRAWAQRETFGVGMHIDVVKEKNRAGTVVEVTATSTGGYSGPGTFSLTIRGGLIERFVIR
jgi:SnoaL-like protein